MELRQQKRVLKNNLPKVSQLNKKFILGLFAVVGLLILMIFMSVFSSSAPPAHQEAGPLKGVGKSNLTPSGLVTQLPNSYAETDSVKSILNRGLTSDNLSPALNQELATLRAQQAALQNQLSSLKSKPASPSSEEAPMGSLGAAALSSPIFAVGGAPTPIPADKAALLADSDASKKAADADAKDADKNSYQSQNMQAQKLDFLKGNKPNAEIYNKNAVQYPVSPYILQAGANIPAILKTELNSDNPGYITAMVMQDVYDSINGQYLLIPKGSTLIGEYSSQVAYGQSALQAKFERLIRPDGSSIILPNELGANSKGVAGLRDKVDNHWGSVIGSAVLAAVFNIPAIVATNQMNQSNGYAPVPGSTQYDYNSNAGSTLSASALQSVGQGATQLGNQLTQRSLNLQPTIVVRPGYQFGVMVTKDIILPPYQASEG